MENNLENRLFNYLKKNPKIIFDSLDNSMVFYDKNNWKLESIYIEDDEFFECRVILHENTLPAVSILLIPKEFLRKEKLNNLNEKNLM